MELQVCQAFSPVAPLCKTVVKDAERENLISIHCAYNPSRQWRRKQENLVAYPRCQVNWKSKYNVQALCSKSISYSQVHPVSENENTVLFLLIIVHGLSSFGCSSYFFQLCIFPTWKQIKRLFLFLTSP